MLFPLVWLPLETTKGTTAHDWLYIWGIPCKVSYPVNLARQRKQEIPSVCNKIRTSRGPLNINMLFYQYRDSHYKDTRSYNSILVWTQRVKPGFMHALGNTPTLNLVLRGSLDHRRVSRSVGSQNGADPGSLGLSGAPDTGPWTP